MTEVREYAEMTLPEIEALDREKTIFLMALSPLEVHGFHLPLGTDVFISLQLIERYIIQLQKEFPAYSLVKMPPLYLGADALPVKGSVSVPAPLVKGVLLSYVKALAGQGFRYLFLADNHGGPRHQMGIEAASRKAWKKYDFYLINSFNHEFKLMVQHDPAFLQQTGLCAGCCGDDADAHAGTNETSLMLAAAANKVRSSAGELPPYHPPAAGKLLLALGRLVRLFSRGLAKDLEHLAGTLAWVGDPGKRPYVGCPASASPEAGEAMLRARTAVAMEFFRKALAGEPVRTTPMLWGLSFLYRLPE
ncbi:MAG: creatininase family protein [Bacillota bacterium]|nr:creatininase family protein [Bacillota bacterium]MDW7684790.1 creatininase family protein [Bacillota bacterium]